MVAAVRQLVKVEANGRIEILSSELRAGTLAEVIVLLPPQSTVLTPADKLAALHKLRESVALTPEAAEKWKRDVREERKTWNPASR